MKGMPFRSACGCAVVTNVDEEGSMEWCIRVRLGIIIFVLAKVGWVDLFSELILFLCTRVGDICKSILVES